MELELILERELTTMRPPGGALTDVHVCQRDSGQWYINVRVSWRGTALYHVGLYDKKRIRLDITEWQSNNSTFLSTL